jgi:hypothetical protein
MQSWEIILITAIAIAVLAAIGWAVYSRRTQHLRKHFGTEYDRTVSEFGDRRRAEANLSRREARIRKLKIQPLSVSDRKRFGCGSFRTK